MLNDGPPPPLLIAFLFQFRNGDTHRGGEIKYKGLERSLINMDGHLHIICRLKRQWLIMDIISCQELIGDTEMRYGKGFIERDLKKID